MESPILRFPLYAKFAFILLIISIIMSLLYIGQNILIPLLLALLFAILLIPVVVLFNKKLRLPHVFAVLLSVTLFVIFIVSIVMFVTWQVSYITDDWIKIKNNFSIHFQHIQQWIVENYNISYSKQQNYINEVTDGAFKGNREFMGSTLNSFTSTLLNLVLIPIYTFLILLYRAQFKDFLFKIFSQKNELALVSVLKEVKVVVQSYILGLLIEMSIVGTLTTTGFIILGVPYALLLGVITAILNLIPYIGILAAGIIAILATLGNSTDVSMILGIIATNTVVQLIDNNIVVPKIVGHKVHINALATMVGVIVGGAAWGIPGMVLSIPLIAIFKVICDHIDDLKPWGYLLGNVTPTYRKSIGNKQKTYPAKQ